MGNRGFYGFEEAPEVVGSDFLPYGLTGATAASRYVGGTSSGSPSSGVFSLGDFVVDQTGSLWVCTGAGSPGTWKKLGALEVKELDLTPDVVGVTSMTFPEGSLTDNGGGAVTIDFTVAPGNLLFSLGVTVGLS